MSGEAMTRDELVASVQIMRAALRAALRCASGPVPDWAGAAKELDGVNEMSCELWRGCVRESWRVAAGYAATADCKRAVIDASRRDILAANRRGAAAATAAHHARDKRDVYHRVRDIRAEVAAEDRERGRRGDDERREVAERLHSANEHSCSPDCELRYALDGSHGCKGNGCTGCHRDAFDRLADLIYQGDTSLSCRDIVACDREALLALAADMDLYARTAPYPSFGRRVATYARRIRESLGSMMDKSSITWTRGSDWWLSRTTMGGKERYPKQIRVGDLDRPRVYYPIDRDALLALVDEMDRDGKIQRGRQKAGERWFIDGLDVREYARRIREALGVVA